MSDQKPTKNPFDNLDRHYAEQEMENEGLPPYSPGDIGAHSASRTPETRDLSNSQSEKNGASGDVKHSPVDYSTLPEVVPTEQESLPEVVTGANASYYNESFFNQTAAGHPPVGSPPMEGQRPIGGPGQGPMGPGMMGPGMMGPGPMGPGAMGSGPMGPGQMGTGPMGPGQMSPGLMGPGQMGPGAMGGPPPMPLPLPQDRTMAIPAVDATPGSPLIRAYPPILANYNLPKDSFLTFLDTLNDGIATNPPMQVLDVTGGILKSVPILFPLHWIGSAFTGLASMSEQGKSKGRSDTILKQANKDIFGPRGLKAELANMDALAYIARIPILDSQGKVNKKSAIARQLKDLALESEQHGHSKEEEVSHEMDVQQQRLRVLQPWLADLQLDVKPWTSKSKLTRFNSALKKYNEPRRRESRLRSGSDVVDEKDKYRKSIWLVIRELNGNGESLAGPSH